MEDLGYVVDHRHTQFDSGNLVVMKDGLYYVAVKYDVVAEAPLEYMLDYVDREFQRLKEGR